MPERALEASIAPSQLGEISADSSVSRDVDVRVGTRGAVLTVGEVGAVRRPVGVGGVGEEANGGSMGTLVA